MGKNAFEKNMQENLDGIREEQAAVQASLDVIAGKAAKKWGIDPRLAKAMVDGAMLMLQDYVSERTQIMFVLSGNFSALPEEMRPTAEDRQQATRDGWLLVVRLKSLTAYHARMWSNVLQTMFPDKEEARNAEQANSWIMELVLELLIENCERIWNASLNTTAEADASTALDRILQAASGPGGNDKIH